MTDILSVGLIMLIAMNSCGVKKNTPVLEPEKIDKVEALPVPVETKEAQNRKGGIMKKDYGGHEAFAMDMMQTANKLAAKDENIILSPHSAGVAMSMVVEGAEGETEMEIKRAFRYWTFAKDTLYADEDNKVYSANSAWIREGFSVKDDYKEDIRKKYDAEINVRDFASPATPKEINLWCSQHTEGKIPAIIDKMDSGLEMLLVNALYFKSTWQYKFNARNTSKDTFHGASGKEKVEFMNRSAKFGYVDWDGYQVALLPYVGNRYGMLVVLPPKGVDIDTLVGKLDYKNFRAAISVAKLNNDVVDLKMPKFKLETTKVLNEVLENMGIKKVFTSDAELKGISDASLMVSKVLQKCFVEVDEEGSEAAAVTSVGVSLTSARPIMKEPIKMIVDRPFLFAIVDTQTLSVLFEGKIVTLK